MAGVIRESETNNLIWGYGGLLPRIVGWIGGSAPPQIDTSEEADEGVGCGSGDPPHRASWPRRSCAE
jgi:hypothetical protein